MGSTLLRLTTCYPWSRGHIIRLMNNTKRKEPSDFVYALIGLIIVAFVVFGIVLAVKPVVRNALELRSERIARERAVEPRGTHSPDSVAMCAKTFKQAEQIEASFQDKGNSLSMSIPEVFQLVEEEASKKVYVWGEITITMMRKANKPEKTVEQKLAEFDKYQPLESVKRNRYYTVSWKDDSTFNYEKAFLTDAGWYSIRLVCPDNYQEIATHLVKTISKLKIQ